MIELLAALFVLAIGILSSLAVFESSQHATSVSEAQQAEIHRAQKEIERLQSLPYSRLGLTAAPATSTSTNNPGYYVSSATGACPATPSGPAQTFQWNQSPGITGGSPLVINGCTYSGAAFSGGSVAPTQTWTDSGTGATYTIYDYVTWVTDSLCAPGVGCPINNDYKRVTVEVTSNSPARSSPTQPILVSSIVADQHALPVVGNPNASNPLDNTQITCTNSSGQQVTCNNGLGNQTANTFYLTNSLEKNGYTPPSANNSCAHFTNQLIPLLGCSGSLGVCLGGLLPNLTGCPTPDLLNPTAPPSSITQEFNFSPNISGVPASGGRVILRDSNATTCASTPSNDATKGEFWATQPLGAQLNLSGNGGLTLYTSTVHGLSVSVTLCVGVYLESPILGILDPLNLLGGSDSVRLGVVAYTMAQWPAVPTPVSFTFNYLSSARLVAAGTSLAVRVWLTAGSGDDIVAQYDAPTVASSVQINSQ